jgi:hypothetical protein
MADNWGFVAAAYAVATVVFGAYWRRLIRRERELAIINAGVRNDRTGARNDRMSRSRQPSETGHPRPEPGNRHLLP